ncbi:hypothetical protein LguiA_003911 [Lonicera macranthoides]
MRRPFMQFYLHVESTCTLNTRRKTLGSAKCASGVLKATSTDPWSASFMVETRTKRRITNKLYESLCNTVNGGDLEATKCIITQQPNVVSPEISSHGGTALPIAILAGHLKIANELVNKMQPADLEKTNELIGATPFSLAAISGDRKLSRAMVEKKFQVDVASRLLKLYPQLGCVVEDLCGNYALRTLAQKPSAFPSGTRHVFKFGNNGSTYRNYLPLLKSSAYPVRGSCVDAKGNYNGFGRWRALYNPRYKEQVNENNRRPSTLFSKENKDLAKEGERWMKHAAASSMTAGTLIAAVMFTTAFQVPGGTNDETGLPIMLETDRYAFFYFYVVKWTINVHFIDISVDRCF